MLPFPVLILVEIFYLLLFICSVFQLQLQCLCNICTHETCLSAGRLVCADRLWPGIQQPSLLCTAVTTVYAWVLSLCKAHQDSFFLCLYVRVIITLICTDFFYHQKATFTRKLQSSSLLPGLYPPRSTAFLCCTVILNILRWVVDGETKTTNQSVCFILLLITLYQRCKMIGFAVQRIVIIILHLLLLKNVYID